MTAQQEQITVTIRRTPNTGLGISIAGGSGSAAFKDNDYVRIIYCMSIKIFPKALMALIFHLMP